MTKRIIIKVDPIRNQLGVIQDHGYGDVLVGPMETDQGTAYFYKIGPYISKNPYANSASAWYDARRPQRITLDGELEPDLETEASNMREAELCYATA